MRPLDLADRGSEFDAHRRTRDRLAAALRTLRAIRLVLDGQEWNAETTDEIARLVAAAGDLIRDVRPIEPASCPECERAHGPGYRGRCEH